MLQRMVNYLYFNQLLKLCTARKVWPDAVIRLARFAKSTIQMGTQSASMIYPQTSYDSEVLTEDGGVIQGFPIDGNYETSNDSVVLTKDAVVKCLERRRSRAITTAQLWCRKSP